MAVASNFALHAARAAPLATRLPEQSLAVGRYRGTYDGLGVIVDVGAFGRAVHVLEVAGFEGGTGARILNRTLLRLEVGADTNRIDLALNCSRNVLERAMARGVIDDADVLADAHRTAGNVLAALRG